MPTSDVLWAWSMALTFLGRVLLDVPDSDLLHQVREERLLEDWPLPLDSSETEQGLSLMAAGLADRDLAGQSAIARDFSDLFICTDHPVAIWESVWTGREHLLFEEPEVDVRKAYGANGLAIAGADRMPADHLGLELAFVGCLLGRAAQAAERGNGPEARRLTEEVRVFLGRHLGRFAHDCLQEIERRVATDYYRGAARLCRATLGSLGALLEAAATA